MVIVFFRTSAESLLTSFVILDAFNCILVWLTEKIVKWEKNKIVSDFPKGRNYWVFCIMNDGVCNSNFPFLIFSEIISTLLHIFLIRFFNFFWEILGASLEPARAHQLRSKETISSSVHHAAHERKLTLNLFYSWLASTRLKDSFLVL